MSSRCLGAATCAASSSDSTKSSDAPVDGVVPALVGEPLARNFFVVEQEIVHMAHTISACRGAMDALMAEVIDGHIRFHVLPKKGEVTDEQLRAADDLVSALRAYLK